MDALTTAQALLDRGFPFAAHEVLEARWKQCPEDERALWQGLAQACVALTHAARGNQIGAQRLVERTRLTLGDATPAVWSRLGIDGASIERWITETLDALTTQGTDDAALPRLRLLGA